MALAGRALSADWAISAFSCKPQLFRRYPLRPTPVCRAAFSAEGRSENGAANKLLRVAIGDLEIRDVRRLGRGVFSALNGDDLARELGRCTGAADAFQPCSGSRRQRAAPTNLCEAAGSTRVAVSAADPRAVCARQHLASASTARMVGYAPGGGWVGGDGLKTVHAWLPTDDSR
jgi:hypothetical protein